MTVVSTATLKNMSIVMLRHMFHDYYDEIIMAILTVMMPASTRDVVRAMIKIIGKIRGSSRGQ